MDIIIMANVILFGWAFVETVRKLKNNVRMWLRIPAAFISLYYVIIFVFALLGVIPDVDVKLYMRWFQMVVAAYIILESKHG